MTSNNAIAPHAGYAIICVAAYVTCFNAITEIALASELNTCDFGCGFKLNFVVSPFLLMVAIVSVFWFIQFKTIIKDLHLYLVLVLNLLLISALIAYGRVSL